MGSFYCGNSEIDHFLKNSAIVEQEEMLSRTYLICLNNDVIGFFTLSASSIEVLAVDTVDGIEEFPESIYPAIDVSKLAVAKKFQEKEFELLTKIERRYDQVSGIFQRYTDRSY